MRVLLFGGTGFVGSYLIPMLLSRGHEVTVMTRRESELSKLTEAGVRGIVATYSNPRTSAELTTTANVVVRPSMDNLTNSVAS